MGLSWDEINKKPIIFQSISQDHRVYLDVDGKVYVEKNYVEITKYFIYHIVSEKGIFSLLRFETSDISHIHGHVPDVDIYMVGSEKKEAVEILISKIHDDLECEEPISSDIEEWRDGLRTFMLNPAEIYSVVA